MCSPVTLKMKKTKTLCAAEEGSGSVPGCYPFMCSRPFKTASFGMLHFVAVVTHAVGKGRGNEY